MSGHSKWANIKRRKGAQDAARGKLFTKIIREITVAARMGGGDPASNPRLRAAIDKAKAASMPRDNIKRAVAKGSGNLDSDNYEEVQFEGYGPGGVAVLVRVLTDNRNRTTAEVRHAFTKNGGNLGTTGCVGYLFNRLGVLTFDASGVDEDDLMMEALEAGAEDVARDADQYEVTCDPSVFEECRTHLENAGMSPISAEITWVASNDVKVQGRQVDQVMRLIEMLEDSDDVQNVFTNADISDADMERLSQA